MDSDRCTRSTSGISRTKKRDPMNIADPIVPAVRGPKRTARKMMTVSQSAQLNGQEGTSADSEPGLILLPNHRCPCKPVHAQQLLLLLCLKITTLGLPFHMNQQTSKHNIMNHQMKKKNWIMVCLPSMTIYYDYYIL